MITLNKTKALLSFIHSRLSGKYAEYDGGEKVVNSESDSAQLISELGELENDLKSQGYTVEHINNMPKGLISSMQAHYYEVALAVVYKEIKAGEEILEGLIALSILSYLANEKGIGVSSTDAVELIGLYEKQNIERELITKMLMVGTKIVEAVEVSNFTKTIVKKRVSKTRKKRKK